MKTILHIWLVLLFFCLSLAANAENNTNVSSKGGNNKFSRPMLDYIRKNYREELEKLQDLREKDPEAFKAGMKALFVKARKEMRENRKKREKRQKAEEADSIAWVKYSDKLAEIRKLKNEDPEKFKAETKAFQMKIAKEIITEREKFRKLVVDYRKTKDPATLEAIKKFVSDLYDRHLEAAGKRLEAQRERLEQAEKRLEEKKEKKDKIINRRLKVILKDPKLNW